MRFVFFLLFGACLLPSVAIAQGGDVWTLERTVQYALAHNISIQQNKLNERLAELTYRQSRYSQLPGANLTTGYGRSYGRSVDPTTNQFVQGNYDFLSLSGNADVLLFGWFQRRNTIAKNDLNHQASMADLDQLKDDVALNVATGFLRALLAKEQIRVNEKQVELSKQQQGQTRRFVAAGRLPELNLAQLSSQLATDSSNLITAISNYTAAILDLKALLNLDFETPFDIQAPDVAVVDQSLVSSNTPEQIYTEAAKHFGGIKSSSLKLAAARKGVAAARGQLYPQLTIYAQLGSNYATTYKDYGSPVITGSQPTVNYIEVNGQQYFINQPTFSFSDVSTTPINRQVSNNLRQTYGLNLSIPLFNGWQSQTGLRQSQINVQSQELDKYQTELKLKQDVYKAYNDARSSIQKYYAAQRAAEAAGSAFGFAQKRYDLGLTNTIEYLTTQNNQYSADANLISARYDLIFRLKVIDYYLGKALKL